MAQEVWRDDGLDPHGRPAVDIVAIKAVDLVAKKSVLVLYIKHVVGHEGRGFMAAVECGGSINSKVIYGTTNEAYEKTLEIGQNILNKEAEELEAMTNRCKN